MCVNIKLNDLQYRYQVYQIFNLFFSQDNIEFYSDLENDEGNYFVDVNSDGIIIKDNLNSRKYYFETDVNKKECVKKAVYSFLKEKTNKTFPWGTLVGIRPSKIALSLINEGKSNDEIIKYFYRHYLTCEEKAKLCIDVAKKEEEIVNKDSNVISIYIDMPFCPTRCLYCSFASNSIEKKEKLVEEYLKNLSYEIKCISDFVKQKNLTIETVYFGGGTPTSVNDEQFEYIIKRIYNEFICDNQIAEFTVECGRPDSLTYNKFNTMKKYKVDRISINPQTMNDDTLKAIGRRHTVKDVIDKFNMARELGFDNINMDIIIGLPKEGLDHVKHTCSEILKLKPESLTVHGMSIKRGSRLHQSNNIDINLQQSEINSMYAETLNLSKQLNMNPYYMYRQKNMIGNMENVGYSVYNKECIYNIQMIEERQTIIALGADAVSKIAFIDENRIERVPNVKDVIEYNKRVEEMVKRKIEELEKLYK